MISPQYKIIFQHFPKTAGTSIENALCPGIRSNFRGKHWNAKELKNYYEEYWNTYFKFTFTRNPWDRIISKFLFRQKRFNETRTFKKFIKDQTNIHLKALGGKDHEFDFIGRFENLQKDFQVICRQIGVQLELGHFYWNRKRKHYSHYYNNETKLLVEKRYACDIEYFGYSFEEG